METGRAAGRRRGTRRDRYSVADIVAINLRARQSIVELAGEDGERC